MHVTLKTPYRSIKQMDGFDLPDFAVLIGRNGVGKTQLLTGISEGHIVVSGLSRPGIELYNFSSFRSSDSRPSNWGASEFPRTTVERYFTPTVGDPLVKVAEDIFHDTIKTFNLEHDFDRRREFVEQCREIVRSLPDFAVLTASGGNDATPSYFNAIQRQVIQRLSGDKQRRNRPSNTVGNDQAILVSLAYKVDQYWWAHTEGEKSDKSVQTLLREYREAESPPWDTLRSTLDRMRESSDDPELFNFDFSDPEQDILSYANHRDYSFTAMFVNRATGDSYSLDSLSSGEKIILSMCFATYNKTIGQRQPGLLLLDELDAVLHPSMISVLLAGLNELFVTAGTPVIMATHSVTTVSCLDEGVVFRMSRFGRRVSVHPVTRTQAVEELSEGLATLESGTCQRQWDTLRD